MQRSFTFPSSIEGHGIRLEQMTLAHESPLRAAAADGELWLLAFTSVPEPERTRDYIESALAERTAGSRWPFVVRELSNNRIVGSTSYHDIIRDVRRVEIGYTWYRQSRQRTYVNTACKWLLLEHAFERLDCPVVGWRTDNTNIRSQAAIERLGAKKDGVIRRHKLRRDGTVRDTVMYSLTVEEWHAEAKGRIQALLQKCLKQNAARADQIP